MRFLNCSLTECRRVFAKKKIVFFGGGSWLQIINHTPIMEYKSEFIFAIDNGDSKSVSIGDITLEVKKPDAIIGMQSVAIVLTSPVYMYDMYLQLMEYNLDDSCVCVAFPFMQMVSDTETDCKLLDKIKSVDGNRIPKTIHSFWFGQDEKSELYRKCIDSWAKVLPDYNVIEWNQENYDCTSHPFVKKAIEKKAWAFASDYARLDVLYRYGGIYLDMDVEVFKPFDDLLGNNAIFSFSNNVQIDLAVVASRQGNRLIKRLLDLYDDVTLPERREDFSKFFQPSFVRETLCDYGIRMDGSTQILPDATVLSKYFCMPQEHILFAPFERTDDTYCVHYDNFGWSFSKDSKREKKIRDNNILWSKIEENEKN